LNKNGKKKKKKEGFNKNGKKKKKRLTRSLPNPSI
jgi:hypothetical protein